MKIEVARGQNWRVKLRILSPEKLTISEQSIDGAVTLSVKPLQDAWSNGQKIIFDTNRIITLTADAFPGDETITVSAVNGILLDGVIGQRIAAITGMAIKLQVLETPTDITSEALITKDATIIDDASDPATPKAKLAQFDGVPADTEDLEGVKHYFPWRRDADNWHPIENADDDFIIVSKGFIIA